MESSPGRYLVEIQDVDGSWDVLTVWADGPGDALNSAYDWIDWTHRRPVYSQPSKVRKLGTQPDDGDLGIAVRNEDVNHVRFESSGELRDSRYRRAARGIPSWANQASKRW